jgi:hypothetical protein
MTDVRAKPQGFHATSLRQQANWPQHLVQPAIGCDAINDDRGVPKNTEEKLSILGVETVDMVLNKSLNFTRGFAGDGYPPAISHV